MEAENDTLAASAFGPRRDSILVVVPVTVVYALIFVTGLVGNVSTCVVIARNKPMHTATNYYLFSLAVSDLLLLVSGLPQEMYQIWSRYPYVFGYTFCLLRGLFSETSANATVLTITAFTVERYVAICHPFLSHTLAKLSRIVKLIVLIWLVAVCFAIPQAFQLGIHRFDESDPDTEICMPIYRIVDHSFEVSTFLFFCAPMTLITVLYVLIGLKLRSSTNILGAESRRTGGNFVWTNRRGNRHATNQSSKRVLKMLVAVVVAFFICWAPFHAQRLFAIYCTPPNDGTESRKTYLKIYEIMTYVSGVLYYLSTTINPLLYNIMSNKFREAFKETFARCFCCCYDGEKSDGQQKTYSALSRSAQRGQESTDSGRDDSQQTNTTLIHKNSLESTTSFTTSKSLKGSTEKKQRSDDEAPVTLSWNRKRSNIKLTVTPHCKYENIQPNADLIAVQILNPSPQRRTARLVELCHCMTTAEEGKKSPSGRGNTRTDLCSIASAEISNSSLRNMDGVSFRDELSRVFEYNR